MVNVSVPCGKCGRPVRPGDEFCEACGEKVPKELKNMLGEQGASAEWTMATHGKKAESAQKTIGGLAILFLLSGVVMFFVIRSQVDTALGQLGGAADTQPLIHAVGAANTVGELRASLQRQPWQVFGLNVFLAAIMAALWQWSKRALLPAAITALALYVAVIAMSAIYEPASLANGLVLKIIIVVALANGVRSAAAVRRLELAR